MREDYKFRPTGTSLLLSFAELDALMQEQFKNEVVTIDTKLCEIFDSYLTNRHSSQSCLGKMAVRDILVKFR